MSRPVIRLPVLFALAVPPLALSLGCGGGPTSASGTASLPAVVSGPLALAGVNVVTMDHPNALLRDRTVVIRDGRIERIAPDDVELGADVEKIEAEGLFVLPGLVDMHVHLTEEDVPAYLEAGVTTVRDLWGWSEVARIRDEVRAGSIRGPRVLAASPGLDGDPPARPQSWIVVDPAEADGLVAGFVTEGWDFIKLYQNLSLAVYRALTDAAARRGIIPVGHVPTAVPLDTALRRQRSIEHLEGYDKALTGRRLRAFASWAEVNDPDGTAITGLARRTAQAGVWNCPTLLVAARALENNLSPRERDRAVESRRAMVWALHQEGARILAGTDGGLPVVPAGSLTEELVELTRAGLTPYDALRAATANAAEFLGLEQEIGRIFEGARADLVVLEANPLDDVRATERPVGIVLAGEWLRADAIR